MNTFLYWSGVVFWVAVVFAMACELSAWVDNYYRAKVRKQIEHEPMECDAITPFTWHEEE